MTALDDLRALVRARLLVDERVDELTVQALRDGSDRGTVAAVLGVSRSSLYREFGGRMTRDQPEGSER